MSDEKDYQALRKLLLAPEQQALDKIRDDIKQSRDNKVNDVADVLSDSLRLSTRNDKTLAQSLQPAVEDCIQQSVKRDAKFFADILFPIMGPAIRKSIADALKEVVDSINRVMEQSFSKKAMKWRWQSFTTGKSYGEIVLKNTLLYRVDQVFLINRESGLLMQYVTHADWKKGEGKMDSDAVSAMLSAIQDFMRDSFNVEQSDNLDSIDMGDSTVFLSHGPKATLACKVQGTTSHEIKNKMQEVLEYLHLNYYRDMDEFDGDRRSMQATVSSLESLLLEEKKQADNKKQKSFFMSPFFFIFLLLLLTLLVYAGWRYWQKQEFNQYVRQLDTMPGILVTDTGKDNGILWVKGLQDPLVDIKEIEEQANIRNPIDYRFNAYQSLEPDIVRRRATTLLQIPESVQVDYANRILLLSGSLTTQSEIEWYKRFSLSEHYLAGVDRIDTSNINIVKKVEDFIQQYAELINTINSTEFYFSNGDTLQLGEENKFESLIDNIALLAKKAAESSWAYRVIIIGYSDGSGSNDLNQIIRLQRADYIKNQLLKDNRFNLETRAFNGSPTNTNEVDYQSRKTTLQVIVK